MPTTDDGQGIMPLQQKGEHMGNSRYGGATNMNDKDYSKIGGHMSGGHLDSLKDIYGEARREQLYNPVVEDASALSMHHPEATMSSKGSMYEKSQTYNESFDREDIPNMQDLAIGSKARADEYNARGWAHDETTSMSLGKSPTGIISKDAIMYDEYPGPDAPATPAPKKKTEVGTRGGNFLPKDENDPRYKDLKK